MSEQKDTHHKTPHKIHSDSLLNFCFLDCVTRTKYYISSVEEQINFTELMLYCCFYGSIKIFEMLIDNYSHLISFDQIEKSIIVLLTNPEPKKRLSALLANSLQYKIKFPKFWNPDPIIPNKIKIKMLLCLSVFEVFQTQTLMNGLIISIKYSQTESYNFLVGYLTSNMKTLHFYFIKYGFLQFEAALLFLIGILLEDNIVVFNKKSKHYEELKKNSNWFRYYAIFLRLPCELKMFLANIHIDYSHPFIESKYLKKAMRTLV
jgi:hypothetical protein